MGGYVRRNPRRVVLTALLALVVCGGVIAAQEWLAPRVGVASSKAARGPEARLPEAALKALEPPVTPAIEVAQEAVPEEAEEAVPAPTGDAVLDYAAEVLPGIEASDSELSRAVLDATSLYETDGDRVRAVLSLLNAADANLTDPNLSVAAELGSRLFRTMSTSEMESLATQLPDVASLTASDGLYTSAVALYILKVRAEVAKAFGDGTREQELRTRLAAGFLDLVTAHFDVPGPYSAVHLVELLREHRNAVQAVAELKGEPTDIGAVHEILLAGRSPNLLTWTLHAWLAYHYSTAGRDPEKAREHADAVIAEAEAPYVLAALDDGRVTAQARGQLELLLGRAFHYAGRYEEAREQFAWIAGTYAGTEAGVDAEYLGAAAVYAANGFEGAEAEAAFEHFVELHPEHEHVDQARLNLSNLYLAAGDTAGAVAVLERVAAKPEASAVQAKALAQLGMVHSMMGEEGLAAPVYARVVAEYPESPRAGEALSRLSHAKAVLEGAEAGLAVYTEYLAEAPEGELRALAEQEASRLTQQLTAASDAVVAGE